MNRTKCIGTAVALVLAVTLVCLCGPSMAESLRNGSWYNQPAREKGTAFFEMPQAPRMAARAPAPPPKPKPTPKPTVKPTEPPAPPKPMPTKTEVPPTPKPAPRPEVKAPLENIYFDYDKSDLRPRSEEVLGKVAAYLKAKPGAKVAISGHCDSVASDAYNDPLSVRRAESAKAYLVDVLKIAPARIETQGFGKRQPATSNETDEGRQMNRRCIFTFSE